MVRAGPGSRLGLFTMICVAVASCGSSSPPANGLYGIVSRGTANLRFENTDGSNLPPSHIPANEVTVTYREPTMGIVVIDVAGFVNEGGGSYARRWHLTISMKGDPVAGAVYQAAPQTDAAGQVYVLLLDDDVGGSWIADSGTVSVTSVANATVSFAVDVTMTAPGRDSAVGTFSMSGFVVINNINAVCDCIN